MSHLQLAAAPETTATRAVPAIRVVVGDDHSLVRRSMRLLLEREKGLDVVAEAGDITSAIRYVHGHRPHVLLLDLSSPNGSSVDAIRRLRAEAPGTQIIVMTMEDDPAFAREALDAGAIGYVLKDAADEDLPIAVRRAVRDEPFVSRRVSALLRAMRAS